MADDRLLITGGQGFIGRALTRAWLARHPDGLVLGVSRRPSPPDLPDRCAHERADLADRERLRVLAGRFRPTAVVHLAGALRDEPAERLIAVNVGGTVALLEALAGAGITPPRVVLGSSAAVYGAVPTGALPIHETAALRPVDLYGVSKRASEEAATALAVRHAIPLVVARIFNVIGPGQDARHVCAAIARQIAEIANGRRAPTIELGSLEPTRDFVDVRDVAAALALLADVGRAGDVVNVASGRETSVGELLALAIGAAGVDRPIARVSRPPRPGEIARHVADLGRLRAYGFTPRVRLEQSIIDVMAAPPEPAPPPAPLEVEVTATHRYAVEIEPGLLAAVPGRLAARFPGARLMILTDERVASLHGGELLDRLRAIDPGARAILVPEGEAAKELEVARAVVDDLRNAAFDRRAVLVNLGGGAVTDLGGFVASIYLRGVAYVNVPTTLLSQHDSAIGGKVAVNTPFAKNFLGAFHHPCAVYIDPATVATLTPRHVAAGVAEAIKVAICGDRDLFELLEREVEAITVRRDPHVLGRVVRDAAARKIALLAPDPYEVDLRRALNLGHTFGHPLETELAYEGLLHGEAVAFGMCVATEVALARGVCTESDAGRIYDLLRAYGLPPAVPRERLRGVYDRFHEIRLVRGRQLHFVLPAAIDAVQIVPELGEAEVRDAVDRVVDRLAADELPEAAAC